MDNPHILPLSLVVFLPTAGALLLALFFPKDKPQAIKLFSLGVTGIVFLITIWMAIPRSAGADTTQFMLGEPGMQGMFSLPWIPAFNINYLMGFDGVSFPLIILTSFLTMLAMGASWNIERQVKAYCILFLLLETGMLGVFTSLDFFLFYVFWEVMLLPMYFLIGVWGGPRKEYAAIKFFLFTLFGSVLMLIAILMLYFNSDLTLFKDNPRLLVDTHVVDPRLPEAEQQAAIARILESPDPQHTFNLLALAEMGQMADSPFSQVEDNILGHSLQWWSFLLLFIGFVIKVPAVPFHTWLPDAHVEAPTPISMILAGVLLKMGGYGIIRICYPICPDAAYDLAWLVCTTGVVSMVYGAFAAMAQTDFKRLVAYSSVSHMGYVVLGIGVWSATREQAHPYFPYYWSQGMNGAMFQMIAHGISSAGMFFMVGVVYDRVHHRNLNQFGGLFARMPVYSGLAIGIFFAGLGLPGLCGFIGEVMVTMSVWNYNQALAVVSASVVILTAGYILWALQRVYLGPEYKGPHGDHLTPITSRELSIAAPLLAFAVLFGVFPQALFSYMTPSIDLNVKRLTEWTQTVKEPGLPLPITLPPATAGIAPEPNVAAVAGADL